MRPVCFHQPCKIDPINRARSLDISEKQGRLFGALCDDSKGISAKDWVDDTLMRMRGKDLGDAQ